MLILVDDRPTDHIEAESVVVGLVAAKPCRLLAAAALCNDAVLKAAGQPDSGDPLEVALLRAARLAGFDRAQLARDCPEVARQPFDSETRMMATVHRTSNGFLIAAKGAPEAILERASRIACASGNCPLNEEQRTRFRDKVAELGREGLRVLAIAERTAAQPAAV